MKRVKVMLAGIAVLAVIGGTFAFKAKTAFGTFVYTSTQSSGCNVANVNSTTGGTNTAGVFYTTAATPISNNPCFATKVNIVAED